jgi:hypothetical protein
VDWASIMICLSPIFSFKLCYAMIQSGR